MWTVFASEKGGSGKTLLGNTLVAANALNTKINVRLPRGREDIRCPAPQGNPTAA